MNIRRIRRRMKKTKKTNNDTKKKEDEPKRGLDSPRYREKFVSTFSTCLSGLAKLAGVDKKLQSAILVAAFDCPRNEIWRLGVSDGYKRTRAHNEEAASHFAIVKDQKLFDVDSVSAKIAQSGLQFPPCATPASGGARGHRGRPKAVTRTPLASCDHTNHFSSLQGLHHLALPFRSNFLPLTALPTKAM